MRLRHRGDLTHQQISFLKSGLRIVAYCLIGLNYRVCAIVVFVCAELLGIVEEI